ncbi:GNAT family N-acetyltransferase [Paenibacillus massiliensis]|uniref:GNAT family N-acetyltransferase n=1 Tax=Paenibacillus massiliensis TaxID=225917 RepID=UPI001B7FEF50
MGEQHRGNRLSEKLILSVLTYAKELGFEKVYLVSDHVNLYEKYGFVKIDEKEAPWGAMETIFMHLT